MKTITTCFALALCTLAAHAQVRTLGGAHGKREAIATDGSTERPGRAKGGGGAIWTNDFSNPSDWVTGNFPGTPPVQWQIGTGLQCTGDYPIAPIQSTTYDNGCALLDSDAFNNQSGVPESSHLTTAAPLDLSAFPYVVLQFETFYRKWTNEECYVVVSTNNTDWPALTPTSNISGLPNVFRVWPGMEVQAPVANPTLKRINISAAAGGQPQVWIRFHWTGVWGYAWWIDDVAVLEQPDNDVEMLSAFVSHTGEGEQYGRVPAAQLNPQLNIGGEYQNFGYLPQTNVQVQMQLRDAANNLVLSASTVPIALAPGASNSMDQSPNLPALSNSLYTATFTVTSNEETGGPHFGNNTRLRTMEVTNLLYALDGIGIHPPGTEAITSLGTSSFGENSDGFMMLTYYPVRSLLTVYGIEFLITPSTVPDAAVVVALHTASNVLNDEVGLPIADSPIHSVTAAEVAAGKVRILFPTPVNLAPGEYYAGVEMFSNGGSNHIRIVSDNTVFQPDLASVIYLPSELEVFTNGNAAAIRLVTDPALGVAEGELAGVQLFPNPTDGPLTFSAPPGSYAVEVFDAVGALVRTARLGGPGTIDLAGLAPGVYNVRVDNGQARTTRPVVLR
jgi:hypothetical protein